MLSFTTIVPAFNSSSTIEETIYSLTKQNRKSDQIIVVDDGSIDDTATLVKKFHGIELIQQSNAGVAAARNIGAYRSRGEWIAFCDSDDVWHPDKLAVIERCIEKFPKSFFFHHNFYLLGREMSRLYKGVAEGTDTIFPFFRENRLSFKDIYPEHYILAPNDVSWSTVPIYMGNAFPWLVLGNFILPSTAVIKRSAFMSLSGFDENFRYAEDTEFFLRLSKDLNFFFIDLPLTGYRAFSGGLSSNAESSLENGMQALFNNAVNDPRQYKRYKKRIHTSIARRYGRMATTQLAKNNRLQAWRYLLKGFRFSWTDGSLWKKMLAFMLPLVLVEYLVKLNRGKRNFY